MGLFISTVIGYSVLILGAGGILIYYLRKGLDMHSSELIDPKPEKKY